VVYGVDRAVAERADRLKREAVTVVALVLVVDGLFIGGYFAAGLVHASGLVKLVYAAAWTLVTMVVVLRALTRIRAIRSGSAG
jgi:hypothetical protein